MPHLLSLPRRAAALTLAAALGWPGGTAAAPLAAPDFCEPNDGPTAPCALPTGAVVAGLNFADGSPDVYSFLLDAPGAYTVIAAGPAELSVRVLRADASGGPPLAEGPGDAPLRLEVAAAGWYLVEVVNDTPAGRASAYSLSVRSAAASQAPGPAERPGDLLENNYDGHHAARIAWGVPYDLSLECPDPRPDACYAGDHDFLLLPAKRGVPLVALTYDLGPGADTVLTLYRPDPAQTSSAPGMVPGWSFVTSNDDIAAGATLRSQVLTTPTWSGDALLVVNPSERRAPPSVPGAEGPPGRYRLLAGSPGLPAIQAVLADQPELQPTPRPNPPGPTAAPAQPTAPPAPSPAPATTVGASFVGAPAPGPGADEEEVIRETCTIGHAQVSRDDAPFYSAANPSGERRLLATYPAGTGVRLIGSCYNGWVKAQPDRSVTPGWMFAPDLLLVEGAPVSDGATSSRSDPALPPATPSLATPSAAPAPLVVAATATPLPAATPRPRQSLAVVVRVTDGGASPRAGVRVQLVDAFGAVLVEALTPASGEVTLPAELPSGAAVFVQAPALGLRAPVDPARPLVEIALPRGSS